MADLLDRILDQSTRGIAKAMDLTWQRHEAISANIANAETPTYRAVDVNFERELERAFSEDSTGMVKTNPMHLDQAGTREAHLAPDFSGVTKPDGNNVDIDIQMGKLAQNSNNYSMATNLMRKKLGMFRRMITDVR